MTQSKLFPLRLPPAFHGIPKPYRRPSQISRQLSQYRQNPQYVQTKIGNWQLKRFDKDVEAERREFLVHPAKISSDTPQWFKTTFHYFHKNNYNAINKRNNNHIQYDVMSSRKKQNALANSSNLSERIKKESLVSEKVNARDLSLTGARWNLVKSDVTNKVGSVQLRDYSIRKPQLKIGINRPENFVNTYSVF